MTDQDSTPEGDGFSIQFAHNHWWRAVETPEEHAARRDEWMAQWSGQGRTVPHLLWANPKCSLAPQTVKRLRAGLERAQAGARDAYARVLGQEWATLESSLEELGFAHVRVRGAEKGFVDFLAQTVYTGADGPFAMRVEHLRERAAEVESGRRDASNRRAMIGKWFSNFGAEALCDALSVLIEGGDLDAGVDHSPEAQAIVAALAKSVPAVFRDVDHVRPGAQSYPGELLAAVRDRRANAREVSVHERTRTLKQTGLWAQTMGMVELSAPVVCREHRWALEGTGASCCREHALRHVSVECGERAQWISHVDGKERCTRHAWRRHKQAQG